ncbi:hypothetical protein ABTU80_003409 [Enterobacter cloacae]
MMVIALDELRKKLGLHCYIPRPCEDSDDLIQLQDIRGPTLAGTHAS